MKAVVTGATGAVGTALMKHLRERGDEAVAWDRAKTPIDDYHAMEAWLKEVAPDVLFHLAIASNPTGRENEGWLVNWHWPSELAWLARMLGFKMLYVSTVMVYGDRPGPYTPNVAPRPNEGYGEFKRDAEQRVFSQNPGAIVARIGWQIGEAPGSNNMIDFLEKKQKEEGKISASTKWLPSTSFLPDTCDALARLGESAGPGLYLIDGNEKWNFAEIVRGLNAKHGGKWTIEETTDFVSDQRMLDPRPKTRPLSATLKSLSK
jgi:dTDP-4-dehydrorhamnose reductase